MARVRRPRRLVVGLLGAVALLAVAAGLLARRAEPPGPEREVASYLDAWSRADLAAMQALVVDPPPSFAADHRGVADALRVTEARYVPGRVSRDGDRATVPYAATLVLRGLGEWRYDASLPLVRRDDRWLVQWSPAALHPSLGPGQRLVRSRSRPDRAPVLGAGDQPLVGAGEVVRVGVEPRRVADRAVVAQALRQHVGVDPARLDAELDRPGLRPDVFVPLAELRPARYDQVRPALHPVPGVVFQRSSGRLAVGDDFAVHLLGRTGEVTAEQLEQLGSLYQPGDVVGRSGIEAAFERQLAGTPSGEVRVVDQAGATVRVLQSFTGTAPTPVRTTIDPAAQSAAERSLDGVTGPAAVVAVDGATGAVLAAASRPLDQPFNRALAGRYPPGSTFKVVTTSALLAGGLTGASPVTCEQRAVVGGKAFKNFESSSLGPVPFARAFSESCNTAFVTLGAGAGAEALEWAATSFGFGTETAIGVASFGGSFLTPADEAETAAAAIGQARVEASPLHMATVAAAVGGGAWRSPMLVTGDGSQPPPAQPQQAEAQTPPEVRPLDPGAVAALRQLMSGVVRDGSGTAAAVSGQDIGGKTGTAEFGRGDPLPTHAWFIGVRGAIGISVLVEGGGVGGRVAAPIGARFFSGFPPL